MKKRAKIGFDFEIDELTNSFKNPISGDSFSTDISRITKAYLKNINKKEIALPGTIYQMVKDHTQEPHHYTAFLECQHIY